MNFVADHLTLIIFLLFVFAGLCGIFVGLRLDDVSDDYPPLDDP